jgi:hypothetical protein
LTTNNTPKQISRRDAFKLIAAAGVVTASVLPDKWTQPVLQFGALPAHAQTSVVPRYVLNCTPSPAPQVIFTLGFEGTSVATISPVAQNVSLTYTITSTAGTFISPSPLTNTVLTDAAGSASIAFLINTGFGGGTVTVTWTFTNPADGTGSCVTNYQWIITA